MMAIDGRGIIALGKMWSAFLMDTTHSDIIRFSNELQQVRTQFLDRVMTYSKGHLLRRNSSFTEPPSDFLIEYYHSLTREGENLPSVSSKRDEEPDWVSQVHPFSFVCFDFSR
jgi:hypothetical protein